MFEEDDLEKLEEFLKEVDEDLKKLYADELLQDPSVWNFKKEYESNLRTKKKTNPR